MASKRINLRSADGSFPFPVETPRVYRFTSSVNRLVTASPIPVPKVAYPWHVYLDLSKWNWPVDLTVAYERGIRAVWLKQGQGAWPDEHFDDLFLAADNAGLKVGFYHFFDPTQTSVTPEAAAALAFDMIHGKGEFSLWLDVEWRGALSQLELLQRLVRFCDTFRGLSERKIELYTRPAFFNSYVARSNYWRLMKIDLVAARYNLSLASPWSDGLFVPQDWDYAGIVFNKWQYDDTNGLGSYFGSSGALSVDLNVFPGTFSDLVENQTGEPDEIEIVINPNTSFVVQSDVLNCRNYPTTAAYFDGQPVVVLAQAHKGDVIRLVAEVENVYAPGLYNEVWARGVLPDGATVGWLAVVHGNYPYLKSIDG